MMMNDDEMQQIAGRRCFCGYWPCPTHTDEERIEHVEQERLKATAADLAPPTNHEEAQRERAGVCDTLEARAAKASFEEDHSVGKRWKGRSRMSDSIPHSYGGTGRNFVD